MPPHMNFMYWKEREEEATYTTYVRGDRIYQPKSEGKDNNCITLTSVLLVSKTSSTGTTLSAVEMGTVLLTS